MLCLRFETIWLNVIHVTIHFLCSKLSVAIAGKNGKLTHFNTHFSQRTTDIYSSYIASRIGDKRSTTFFLIFFPSYSFFLSLDRRSSPAPSFVFVVVATKQQPIHHFIHPLSLPFLCFFHVASSSLCTRLGRNSR
jgi:hypothetical protein